MRLENVYFKKEYRYNPKFVNKCIAVIRYSKSEKRVQAYKNLVFKMMKDIVKKNISNYLNLLSHTPRKNSLPERDDVVIDCYLLFDKCVQKFKLNKTYNFYFYFNKSLSRSFFREYQKELKKCESSATEALMTTHRGFHNGDEVDGVGILLNNAGFTDLEIRICNAKMLGQKTSEFLKANPDVTNTQYSKAFKRIKEILIKLKERGEL